MRHIEKLKKIFSCCGKDCSKNTNGEALNELVTMAENGELVSSEQIKSEQSKSITITENGESTVLPDEGFTLNQVNIGVNVDFESPTKIYRWHTNQHLENWYTFTRYPKENDICFSVKREVEKISNSGTKLYKSVYFSKITKFTHQHYGSSDYDYIEHELLPDKSFLYVEEIDLVTGFFYVRETNENFGLIKAEADDF